MPPAQDGRSATDGEVTVADQVHPSRRRVVLKLSGQAFGGDEPLGISPDAVIHIAREISSADPREMPGAVRFTGSITVKCRGAS
jgi:hypothetical protein